MLRDQRLQILARKSPWDFGIDLCIGREAGDGGFSYGQPIVFKNDRPGLCPEATLHLEDQEAQMLMDQLWQVGFRPTEGSGSAGSLAATERHLKDLQKYVDLVLPSLLDRN
jgi:hypothetical protein